MKVWEDSIWAQSFRASTPAFQTPACTALAAGTPLLRPVSVWELMMSFIVHTFSCGLQRVFHCHAILGTTPTIRPQHKLAAVIQANHWPRIPFSTMSALMAC